MQFDQCINTWLRGLTESSFSDDWEKLLPILFWPRSALVMDGFRQDLKEGQLFISDRDVESYNCGSHTIRSRTDAAGPTAVRDTSWSPRAAAAAFTHHSLNFAISSLFNKRPASSSKKSGRTGADNGLPGNRRRTPKALPLSTTFVIQIIVTSLNVFVRLQFLNINNTSHQPNVDDLTVS